MPAPAECSAGRQIRGKARSRTNAQSVGAGQRLGHNLEKLSDAEGCVIGEVVLWTAAGGPRPALLQTV